MPASRAFAFDPASRRQLHVAQRFVVKPAPPREPPFDDELPARHLTVVGPHDRPLPFEIDDLNAPSAMRQGKPKDSFDVQPTGRSDLPDIRIFSRRMAIGIIEIATGRRPAGQLSRHTAPAVQAGLARDAGTITRLGSAQRPATVHSIHITEPADGVAEVAAIVRVGSRFRAIAMRFEGLDGSWRCVRLQIG
jgi:hypothetical protein